MVKDYLSDGGGNLVRTVRQKGEGMVEDARREALAAADEPWDQAEEELGDALNDASNNLEEQAGDMLDDATGAAGEDGPRRRAAADSDQDPFAF
jgi:vacuolar-type H+-ATPase subunit H